MEVLTESMAAADQRWRICLLQNLPITETGRFLRIVQQIVGYVMIILCRV